MTYPLILIPFVLVTLIVTVLATRRPRARERLVASLWTTVVLVVLTAVFDNAMIAADLFTYPAEHISGIRIGLAPIEDFAYPVCIAFLLPSIAALLPERRDAR
ncbi:lycopene cyclase domain-containing protein [Microbacterium oleivorans]|uniref:Lycopene cyclase domain-containing protein n=1 Tax=Microbacterium oleivorans TaxID=273677 RepID=A0A031FR32_9MICO|nr:lycopene cyclase domain-containing protein [Microbacterium oleivorans]EZP27058.1 Lycopene cyclase domain-containing protein [Microbacterium oleivorans]